MTEEEYRSVCVKNEDTLKGEHRIEITQESPIHLLDQLRRYVLDDPHEKKDTGRDKRKKNTNEDLDMITYRNKKRGPISSVIIQRCCGGTKWTDERGYKEKSVSRLLSG